MKKTFAILACIASVFVLSGCTTSSPTAGIPEPIERAIETPIMFEASSGQSVAAFAGAFTVSENRDDPDSRTLTLKYVRFPATGDAGGSPIIYLAGGPGGSGIQTAKHQRFPMFMAMRAFGDVIAFDQRGTGASNDAPNCVSSQINDDTARLSDAQHIKMQKDALSECLGFWQSQGVDVHGYTTPQNVADLVCQRRYPSTQSSGDS